LTCCFYLEESSERASAFFLAFLWWATLSPRFVRCLFFTFHWVV
jgi:hypothetical protein